MEIIYKNNKYSLISESVQPNTSLKNAIKTLNDAFNSDPDAISKLFEYRVTCNEQLANHPLIQVREEDNGEFTVGILGILNGIFGKDNKGVGYIKADMEDGDELQGFHQ